MAVSLFFWYLQFHYGISNTTNDDDHDDVSFSDDSFVVGSSLELLFNIRPRSPTGLLLHFGDSSENQGHYLRVYMLRGEVRPDSM